MHPKIKKLSKRFFNDYPIKDYPEIEQDILRPYILLVFLVNGLYLCVPLRTNINHLNGYLFKNSQRSKSNKSGIDYSKTIIIQDLSYLDGDQVIDKDEYNELAINIKKIKSGLTNYVTKYINHHRNINRLHFREYNRKYKYTTLQYFHDLLGI